MSIKIKGLKYLEENDYSNISIEKIGFNYAITILPSDNWMPKIKCKERESIISERINSKENVKAIMRKFYEQNNITGLGRTFVGYDDDRYDYFKSNHRKMIIKLNNYNFRDVLNEGYSNYLKARKELLYLDNNKKYIVEKDSDRYAFDILDDTTKIILNCSKNNIQSENEFLKEILDLKLNEQFEKAYFEFKEEPYDSSGIKKVVAYLKCGEFELRTSDVSVYNIMHEYVDIYNDKREKEMSKYKQLKFDI